MLLARPSVHSPRPKRRHDLDRGAYLIKGEAAAGEDFLVAAGMQVAEAFGELDLLAIDRDRAIGGLAVPRLRDVLAVDRQEPTHLGASAFEIAGRPLVLAQVHDIAADRPEDERQHVEEMHADIGGDAARLRLVALPRGVIPAAAGGDIGEINRELVFGSGGE